MKKKEEDVNAVLIPTVCHTHTLTHFYLLKKNKDQNAQTFDNEHKCGFRVQIKKSNDATPIRLFVKVWNAYINT